MKRYLIIFYGRGDSAFRSTGIIGAARMSKMMHSGNLKANASAFGRCLLLAFVGIVISMSTVAGNAQGTILFKNRDFRDPISGFSYDAPVTLPDGSGASGMDFTGGLFLVEPTGLRLVYTSFFRTGIAAGFFPPAEVVVPGIPAGSPATFRVRVWETSAGSYENAVAGGMLYGEFATSHPENDLFIPFLGPPSGGPFSDPDLSGIQPLTLIPEPRTWALFLAGGAVWLAARRRVL